MNEAPHNSAGDEARFDLLLSRCLETSLSESEESELIELLQRKPSRQQVFVEATLQRGLLQQIFQEDALQSETGKPLSDEGLLVVAPPTDNTPAASGRWNAFRSWAMHRLTLSISAAGVIVASILFALAVWTVPNWVGGSRAARGEQEVVAQLVRETNCRWHGKRPETALTRGRQLELKEGVAEIRFNDGTQLWLEGPGELSISSKTSALLQQGRITAHVPQQAVGFTLRTPHARIVDLGTEFGTLVRSNDTLVKVMSGRVRTTAIQSNLGNAAKGRVVRAGALVRIEQGQVLASNSEAEASFQASNRNLPSIVLGQGYESAVRASRPVAYWRFHDWNGDAIPNSVSADYPLTSRGSISANRVEELDDVATAQFKGEAGARYLYLREPIKQLDQQPYSLELWCQPTMVPPSGEVQSLVTMSEKSTLGHFLLLELQSSVNYMGVLSGKVRYAHRSKPDSSGGVELFAGSAFYAGGWVHLVAVNDLRKIRLYVNGREQASKDVEDSFIKAPDQLAVGALHPVDYDATRPYRGEVDEIALYDRAISAAEVQQHFAAALSDSQAAKVQAERTSN